ncbi:MAG: hypothetical protein IPO02_09810 [Bacteroidetes bacterium]|nr:hypothetical protein [Bacteroidota bacterium]
MDDIADDENIAVEDTRAMFRVQEQYDKLLANNYKNCKDALLDLSMWNDLDVGKRYKIAEKNKVRLFGFLLLDKNNKAEMQPVFKFIWNEPTIEEMKKRDGLK